VIPVEPGGDLLGVVACRQQITRDLLDGELSNGRFRFERVDHPVAPVPHLAQAVDVITVRVCVPSAVSSQGTAMRSP
jgi:hypothetical protein